MAYNTNRLAGISFSDVQTSSLEFSPALDQKRVRAGLLI